MTLYYSAHQAIFNRRGVPVMLKPSKTTLRDGQMQPGVGYLFFNEIENPIWPEAKSGSIVLPSATATGEKNGSQATWGRVVAVGLPASRTTCEPFSAESARRADMRLQPGSWIMLRKANNWTTYGTLKVLQTHDVVAAFPANWSWDDVVDEVQKLESQFKE